MEKGKNIKFNALKALKRRLEKRRKEKEKKEEEVFQKILGFIKKGKPVAFNEHGREFYFRVGKDMYRISFTNRYTDLSQKQEKSYSIIYIIDNYYLSEESKLVLERIEKLLKEFSNTLPTYPD